MDFWNFFHYPAKFLKRKERDMKYRNIVAYLLLVALCLGAVACTATPEADSDIATESTSVESTEADPSNKGEEPDGDTSRESEAVPPVESETKKPADELESEEEETEDPRLSLECAPVVYFDAKGIYELTKDGVYEDMPQLFFGYDEVTYVKEAGQKPYTRLLIYNDYLTVKEASISLCTGRMEVAPYFAVKYRTTVSGVNMEIYTDSVNSSLNASNRILIPVVSDGEWHVEYVNLARIKDFNGSSVNYFRFDFINGTTLPVDAYMEFEYFGFFNSEEDVEMFETGEYVPVIMVDPASGYKESTGIVHASSIDMINGAGGTHSGTFSYRGGNSTAGVDKFNHNATTLDGGLLVFSGWTVVDGGIEKFVWSVDGITWYDAVLHQISDLGNLGQPHIIATQSYTGSTVIDLDNAIKGGGYQGNVSVTNPADRAKGLACELLKVASVGDKVNVRFAAVPKSDPTQLCLIAYVKNVEVVAEFDYEEETEVVETFSPDLLEPEECEEHEISHYWYPLEGQAIEERRCLLCGLALESRSVAFYSSLDFVEDKNGSFKTGCYGVNKIYDKDAKSFVLRDGYDFVLQGWFAVNGGVKDYMYSVDGGATWMVAGNSANLSDKFTTDHIGVITTANIGIAKYDVKGMYRVNLPLKQFAAEKETTVDVLFGAQLANNESVVVTIASFKNVKIPAAPAEGDPTPKPTVKYDKSTDNIYVGATKSENPNGNISGQLFTFDASSADLSASKTVKWQGWAAIEGGFAGWAYSVDDGKTWTPITAGYADTTRPDVIGHITNNLGYTNATKNGNLNLEVDLSAYGGQTVSVIFGGYAVNDPETVIPMVKIINVNVVATCNHDGVKWTPVEGQLKEVFSCGDCGESITRGVKFYNNIDIIEGKNNGSAATINPPDGIDLLSKPTAAIGSRDGKDVVVQGWLAVNGGVHKYVYSIDGGVTWLECGNQPNYNGAKFANSQPHINAINGLDLGFTASDADVNGMYRVSCDLSAKAGETVVVIFGAILENNRTAPALQLLEVTVSVAG